MKKFSAKRLLLVVAWMVTMVSSLGAGAYGYKHRMQIRALFNPVGESAAITTSLHNVKVSKLAIPADGRDGGIAALADGVLFVDRMGEFYFIDAAKAVRKLNVKAPVNFDEFKADPFSDNVLLHELFGVKDIALQPIASGVRVLVSHNYWHRENDCSALRVTALETTQAQLLTGNAGANAKWRTIFEATPCRPLEKTPDGKFRLALGVGGRVEPLPDGQILVTVGGFDPENEMVLQAPQKLDNSYGKTIRIDPITGQSSVFTIGHRNPQGLTVASNGSIWLTEHAARGGDELNLLGDTKNYGYPRVAYGTQYDEMTWPLSEKQGRHDGYEQPMFVWTPSIGISQAIVLEKNAFPTWHGDLMVSALAAQALYRVRVEDGRVIFVEPIEIGHRIRDIIEDANGTIVLKTDDSFLVYLSPLDATTASTPLERGSILAAQCQSCHNVSAEGGAKIGPTLWNVVGRDIASTEFTYSAALRNTNGRWTPEALKQFLTNPSKFAPGTTMMTGRTYTEAQVADLVAYLQTLK
jgi:cytochrome c2